MAAKNPNCDSDTKDNDTVFEIETDCARSEVPYEVTDDLSHIHLDKTKAEIDREAISSFSHICRHVETSQTEETEVISSSTDNEISAETQISGSTDTQEEIFRSNQPAQDTKDPEGQDVPPEPRYERRVCPSAFTQNEDGDTNLHLAIIDERPDWAYSLIVHAPSAQELNILNKLDQSALHLAVHTDQSWVVRKLLVWGARLDQCDVRGYTALHHACEKGFFHCVQALTYPIIDGERSEVPSDYHLPSQQIPQDLTTVTYEAGGCLHLAAEHNHLDIIRYLVESCGADINIEEHNAGYTILHKAVEKQYASLVEYVITVPTVNLDVQTWAGGTAWQLAVGRGFKDLENILNEAGASRDPLPADTDSETDSEESMTSCSIEEE